MSENNLLDEYISWDRTPRLVITNAAKMIPKVGGFISAFLQQIWPDDKPSVHDLIAESERRMKEWVKGEFVQYDLAKLQDHMQGLRANLAEYQDACDGSSTEERKRWLDNCLNNFNVVKAFFLDPTITTEQHVRTLSLTRDLATLHIGLLHDRVVHSSEIFGSETVNKGAHQKQLTNAIQDYQDFFKTNCPKVVEWRKSQISKYYDGRGLGGPAPENQWRAEDKAANLSENWRVDPKLVDQYSAYIANQLDVQFRHELLDPADSWSLLDPTKKDQYALDPGREVWIGPIGISLHNFVNDHDFPVNKALSRKDPMNAGMIQRIALKHRVILDFIQFRYQNIRGNWVGKDKGGPPLEVVVIPEGEYITSVDTYWDYTCMGIEFHYTNGTSSGIKGRADGRGKLVSVGFPDHILKSVAIDGSNPDGVSEFHFCFSPNPAIYKHLAS